MQEKILSENVGQELYDYLVQKYGDNNYNYEIKIQEQEPRYDSGVTELNFNCPNDYVAALAFMVLDEPTPENINDCFEYADNVDRIKKLASKKIKTFILGVCDVDYWPILFKNNNTHTTLEWHVVDWDEDEEDDDSYGGWKLVAGPDR